MTRPSGHLGSLFSVAAAAALSGVAFGQSTEAAGSAPGAGSGGVLDRPAPSVDALMKRLDALEDRNRELESKVTDLTRQQGEEWLGEQRASQIRDIVRDVLADSDQRASLQDGGITAGWNDGFFLASPDGRFRLNVGGFVQSRFTYSAIHDGPYNNPPGNPRQYVYDRNPSRYGFSIPNVQLWADGHLFSRDFQYMVKARFFEQLTSNINKGDQNNQAAAIPGGPDMSEIELLDAWIRINLDDNWSLRTGQYRSPFSRGFLVLEQYQMSSARSVVDFHYALGYTQGVELEYANDESRVRVSLDDGAQDNLMGDINAAYGAQGFKIWPSGQWGGANSAWWEQSSAFSVTGRIDWKPAGSWEQFRGYTSPSAETFGMLVGLGVHYQTSRGWKANEGTPGTTNPMNEWLALTVDGQANFGGASVYGAVFYNLVDSNAALLPSFGDAQTTGGNPTVASLGNISIIAAQLQGAVYVIPKVELFGRYEFAYITGVDSSQVNSINNQLSNPDPMNLLTIGANWYLDGQDLKWTSDIGWSITDFSPWFADMEAGWRPSRANEIVFRTQLQLMF